MDLPSESLRPYVDETQPMIRHLGFIHLPVHLERHPTPILSTIRIGALIWFAEYTRNSRKTHKSAAGRSRLYAPDYAESSPQEKRVVRNVFFRREGRGPVSDICAASTHRHQASTTTNCLLRGPKSRRVEATRSSLPPFLYCRNYAPPLRPIGKQWLALVRRSYC